MLNLSMATVRLLLVITTGGGTGYTVDLMIVDLGYQPLGLPISTSSSPSNYTKTLVLNGRFVV